MNIYDIIWPDQEIHAGQNTVTCPFHDDDKPSAHLEASKGLFHCKVCDEGMNLNKLTAKFLKTTPIKAEQVLLKLNKAIDIFEFNPAKLALKDNPAAYELLTQFKISKEVLDDLNTGFNRPGLAFPVTLGGHVMDIRTYNPTTKPKVRSMFGAMSGLVFPEKAFDRQTIFLAEGEKDMLVLRTLGLNAATIIGGAMAKPDKTPYLFDNKNLIIIYDNDNAGKLGARKVARYLLENKEINTNIKIADISNLVDNKNKGDVADAVNEFNATKEDFMKLAKETKLVTLDDFDDIAVKDTEYKEVKLEEADQYIGILLKSKVQVAAAYDSSFSVPISASFVDEHQTASWVLEPKHKMEAVMLQLEGNGDKSIRPDDMELSSFDKFSLKVNIDTERRRVFKGLLASTTADLADSDKMATEHTALVMDNPFQSGKEYTIYYKVAPHPKTNRSILLVHKMVDMSKEADKFDITDSVKQSLTQINGQDFPTLIEQAKGIINAPFNDKLVTIIDLSFHSPLLFNFGRYKNIKGTVDSIIVTDTGFGKSVSSQALLSFYKQGARVSLAGSAATPQGLIGGSKAIGSSGTFQTTAGVIPRNHKKIVIFEELAKNNGSIMKELTDIRTSGKAEISRVAGKISLPANTRMMFFSNPKAGRDGSNKTIDAYPNGIEVIQDLLGAREDIGRFDLIAVLGQRESVEDDPSWIPTEPFAQNVYQDRLNWVWTRTADQIEFEEGVEKYIAVDVAKALNEAFESDIQIFGRKTWMKLAKLSITIAGYMASHSKDFTKIVVKKEHVDLAKDLFFSIYDNATFKLREHVAEERSYTRVDEGSKDVMRRIFSHQNQIINQLGLISEIQTNELLTVSSLDRSDFNQTISELTKFKLIRNIKGKIIPTEKFRKILDIVKTEPLETFPSTLEEEALNETEPTGA